MAKSPASQDEIEFIARIIWDKVWQSDPKRWGASLLSADLAIKGMQDYAWEISTPVESEYE